MCGLQSREKCSIIPDSSWPNALHSPHWRPAPPCSRCFAAPPRTPSAAPRHPNLVRHRAPPPALALATLHDLNRHLLLLTHHVATTLTGLSSPQNGAPFPLPPSFLPSTCLQPTLTTSGTLGLTSTVCALHSIIKKETSIIHRSRRKHLFSAPLLPPGRAAPHSA